MIQRKTLEFLKKLSANNSREWFHANRALYDAARADVAEFVTLLLGEMSKFDHTLTGVEAEDCLFRIFRDTRFSREKTPYKTNFGSFMKSGGRTTPGAGYYLHIEPGNSFVSGGIYMPPAPLLLAIRTAIARDPAPFKKIIAAPALVKLFGGLSGETLLTAPKGFPRDHPEIELLRYKHYMVFREIPEKTVLSKEFASVCIEAFMAMRKFNAYLNEVMGL